MSVFSKVTQEGAAQLIPYGFSQEAPKSMYEQLRLRKGKVTAVLYTSGKLLLQGPKEEVAKVTSYAKKIQIGNQKEKLILKKQHGWMIGSDESLKGDTFGGLVVAAVKADASLRKQLIALGVADSKHLKDEEIRPMAHRIKMLVPSSVKSLLPEDYNKQTLKSGAVTDLLNRLHFQVAYDLAPGTHVVDKYPGCKVGDIQETKAESQYLEVAAASVLARAAALQQLNYLSGLIGFTLPKGSTHVTEALAKVPKHTLDYYAKLHFKNVQPYV